MAAKSLSDHLDDIVYERDDLLRARNKSRLIPALQTLSPQQTQNLFKYFKYLATKFTYTF